MFLLFRPPPPPISCVKVCIISLFPPEFPEQLDPPAHFYNLQYSITIPSSTGRGGGGGNRNCLQKVVNRQRKKLHCRGNKVVTLLQKQITWRQKQKWTQHFSIVFYAFEYKEWFQIMNLIIIINFENFHNYFLMVLLEIINLINHVFCQTVNFFYHFYKLDIRINYYC